VSDYAPQVVCFSCSFGWGYLAGQGALAASNPHWLPVVCGGKIEAEQLLAAFRAGADGILLAVCPVGECHFQDGNLQLTKRVALLEPVLAAHGIQAERLLLVLNRDPAGEELPRLVQNFIGRLANLGPLQFTTDALPQGAESLA